MMRKNYLTYLVVSTLLFLTLLKAYGQDPQKAREIEVLKKQLALTKQDTTLIRLRFCVGHESWIFRLGYWDSIAKDANKFNLPLFESRALSKMGYILQLQDNMKEALVFFQKSLKIAEDNGYKEATLSPLINLASAYFVQNDIRKALDFCYKGLKASEELDDKNKIAGFSMLLGEIYRFSGELKKALQQNLYSLNLFKKVNNYGSTAEALIKVGSDYYELRDSAKTIFYFLESLKYESYVAASPFVVQIYESAGMAYELLHQFDSSLLYFEKALKISEHYASKNSVVNSLSHLARINFEKGDINTAKKQSLEAMEIVKSLGFKFAISGLALTLRKIYEKEKDYAKAMSYFELYINTRDSISNEKNRKVALQKQFDYELEKRESENRLLAQQNQIQLLELRQNNYFIWGMAALLLFISVIAYLFIRQNKLKAEQQSSQLEQKLLRSQMNPHFIFNSLQAIQNFVLKNDKKEAVSYLSSFANVTRNVLENSRMDAIPLTKEIALLENYLQLQKLRFNNRFDYKIHMDRTIDTEHINVPPMLTQPFIENAVEHGMHNIDSGGKIDIYYTVKNNFLILEIIDNGYGISSTNNPGRKHQSLAIEITKERIALMNKKAKEKTTFEIDAAYSMEIERKGVKVNFVIPLIATV